jgi:hypothetical protein
MIDRHVTLAAAGFVIAREHCDAFQKRGFAGAVLAGDDSDRPVKAQLEIVAQERQAVWIGRAIGNAQRVEPNAPEVWRRQVDGPISS